MLFLSDRIDAPPSPPTPTPTPTPNRQGFRASYRRSPSSVAKLFWEWVGQKMDDITVC